MPAPFGWVVTSHRRSAGAPATPMTVRDPCDGTVGDRGSSPALAAPAMQWRASPRLPRSPEASRTEQPTMAYDPRCGAVVTTHGERSPATSACDRASGGPRTRAGPNPGSSTSSNQPVVLHGSAWGGQTCCCPERGPVWNWPRSVGGGRQCGAADWAPGVRRRFAVPWRRCRSSRWPCWC